MSSDVPKTSTSQLPITPQTIIDTDKELRRIRRSVWFFFSDKDTHKKFDELAKKQIQDLVSIDVITLSETDKKTISTIAKKILYPPDRMFLEHRGKFIQTQLTDVSQLKLMEKLEHRGKFIQTQLTDVSQLKLMEKYDVEYVIQENCAYKTNGIFVDDLTRKGDISVSLSMRDRTVVAHGTGVSSDGSLRGTGGLGRVLIGTMIDQNQQTTDVALKIVSPNETLSQDMIDRECKVACALKDCTSVAGGIDSCNVTIDGVQYTMLVMKKAKGKELLEMLKNKNPPYTAKDRLTIALNFAKAVQTMHKAGYYHLDLKPDNVFVDDELNVTLVDFGHACKIGTVPTDIGGTSGYIALETYTKKPPSEKTDVYAFGETFYNILTGSNMFPDYTQSVCQQRACTDIKLSKTQIQLLRPYDRSNNGKLNTLINSTLKYNPGDRPTVDEVIVTLQDILKNYDPKSSTGNTA